MAKFGLIDRPMITTLVSYITKLKKNENLKKHCLTPNFNAGKVLYIFLTKTMDTLFS